MSKMYLPDLGVLKATVVSFLKNPGDNLVVDEPLLLVEAEKAQIEVPALFQGVLSSWCCSIGDELLSSSLVCEYDEIEIIEEKSMDKPNLTKTEVVEKFLPGVYASPSVRKEARMLGIDLTKVVASGAKGRITKKDLLKNNVVWTFTATQRASMQHVHKSWQNIPHVTHSMKADITLLEDIRLKNQDKIRFSILVFVLRSVALALQEYPKFSCKLSEDLTQLLRIEHEGINVAVNSDDGLRVPLVRNVMESSMFDLINQVKSLPGKLGLQEMQTGYITVSSLGGIGGNWFTPIINAPQIAIVGIMKASWEPVWVANTWLPKLMLPIVISYDHRAVDGVEAQMFLNAIVKNLEMLHQSQWLGDFCG